jgi:hypothetical protein
VLLMRELVLLLHELVQQKEQHVRLRPCVLLLQRENCAAATAASPPLWLLLLLRRLLLLLRVLTQVTTY